MFSKRNILLTRVPAWNDDIIIEGYKYAIFTYLMIHSEPTRYGLLRPTDAKTVTRDDNTIVRIYVGT